MNNTETQYKYGKNKDLVLALMQKKCDFNKEHNGFDWTGELKISKIMEETGLTETEVKQTINDLIGLGFISQYKTFEVYSINIIVINQTYVPK